MNFQASKINEQTPWQEMTPGGEIYEGGTAKAVRTGRVALRRAGLGPGQMQAVPAVRPLLSRLLHPRLQWKAGRI